MTISDVRGFGAQGGSTERHGGKAAVLSHLCDWHLVVCSNLRAEVLHFVNNALIIIVCMMPFLTLCAFFGFFNLKNERKFL